MSDAHQNAAATAHLHGYCAEIERLAETLTGMLSQYQALGISLGDERVHLEKLGPVVHALGESIDAELVHDRELNSSAQKAASAVRTSGARFIEWNSTGEQTSPQSAAVTSTSRGDTDSSASAQTTDPPATPNANSEPTLESSDVNEAFDRVMGSEECALVKRCANLLMDDLSRETQVDEDAQEGEITLQGTNESLPLPSVFEFLSTTAKTGTLRVKTNEEVFTFEVAAGNVVFSSTDNPPPGQLLGEILVDLGFVTRESMDTFMESQDNKRIGEALENGDLVRMQDLREALEYQIRHRLLRAFRADESAFNFCEGGPSKADDRVRMNVAQLLQTRQS